MDSPTTSTEIELKLHGSGPSCTRADVARVAAQLGIVLHDRRTQTLVDEYLDDDARHLLRAAVGLRIRTTGKKRTLEVKVERARADGVFQNDEITTPWGGPPPKRSGALPPQLRDHVEPYAPLARLRTIATLRTHRERLRGGDLAVALDSVTVATKDGPDATFTELEIELANAGVRPIAEALADALAAEFNLTPSTTNKLERGLAATGAIPTPTFRPLTAELSIVDAARTAIAARLARMQSAEVLVRTTADPDAVRRLRVACRRLRAALRTFQPWLPNDVVRDAYRAVRATARHFGTVRDREAWLAHVGGRLDQLPALLRSGAERLVARLRAQTAVLHEDACRRLRRRRRRAALAALAAAIATPTPGRTTDTVHDVAPRLVQDAAHAVFERGSALGPDAPIEDLHRLRTTIKRLRYTAECFVPVYGKDLARFVERTAHLQEVLGELNDAAVAHDVLCAALTEPHDAMTRAELAALGALSMQEHQRIAHARRTFGPVWDEFAADDVRVWLAATLRG